MSRLDAVRYVSQLRSPAAPIAATARVVAFQKAEVAVGLLLGGGSAALSVPGTTTKVTPAAAVLLLPLLALLAYGFLLLANRPRRFDAGLRIAERPFVRRRTIGWGVLLVVAVLIPSDWIWPLFIAGLAGLVYWLLQLRKLTQRSPR